MTDDRDLFADGYDRGYHRDLADLSNRANAIPSRRERLSVRALLDTHPIRTAPGTPQVSRTARGSPRYPDLRP